MKSQVVKRSVVIGGRKTSISIEDLFWRSLKEIAKEKGQTLSQLVGGIKASRDANSNLSSAIRVFILSDVRARANALAATGEVASGAPEWPAQTRPQRVSGP